MARPSFKYPCPQRKIVKTYKPHVQPIKTGTHGPKLDDMSMQNNPFRAAYFGGHELNESYKKPSPNASGVNHSYMHPAAPPSKSEVSKGNKTPAGPVKTGKNIY